MRLYNIIKFKIEGVHMAKLCVIQKTVQKIMLITAFDF